MIEVKNISKVFNEHKKNEVIAVNNADFSVENGEILGLLGPNGAGKTTTLRMIATILKPTSGNIIVSGGCVNKEPEMVRKHIGFLTGETKLYDRLTVRETLSYFGRLYGIEEITLNKRIDELLVMFELTAARDTRIATLSEGMKQKVSLGRTIIHNPQNLILDEPFTGLDIFARREVTNFMKGAREQHKCIIFSTHVMSEAEELCDRIAIIHGGKILGVGEKEMLKRKFNCRTLEEVFIHLVKS
jgi:sodium transport system ATP-binding protein